MTAANSYIVLTEGLPPATIAAEIIKQLPHYAPTLLNYLDQSKSDMTAIDLSQSRCTAFEYWQVNQAQFSASTAKHNAALALLLAAQQQNLSKLASDTPFWLVELVHIAPARDGAALIPAKDLLISQEQSHDLLRSAQALCEGTPFQLKPWSATHWQLLSDSDLPLSFASSTLVSRTTVNDWWDQDPSSRDWRRFVNEIQMLYFDHPINQQRQQHGYPPINSLWPVGGLCPNAWQPQPASSVQVFTELSEPALRQDWGRWLEQLRMIDQQLASLLVHNPSLMLSNTTHYQTLQAQPKRVWHRFIKPTPVWRNHWLAQS